MIVTSKNYKHDNRCVNCGKGESDHRHTDRACPVGRTGRNFTQYNEKGQCFIDSGKPTIKSSRQHKKLVEQEQREFDRVNELEREKNKVRSMTFHEVVAETRALLRRFTGLGCEHESNYDRDYTELHLVANGVRLGFMSVSKYSDGSVSIGGRTSGCFMASDSDKDIGNVMMQSFRDLEKRANKEKGK